DPDGTYLQLPGLIYDHVPGVAKPTKHQAAQVTGVGTRFGPELRTRLGHDFVDHLARIHTFDVSSTMGIPGFEPVAAGSNESIIRQVNWWRRVWEEDRLEDFPLVNVAAQWLIANAPEVERVSVVHGDYRTGNFLFDESSGRITALLDWELAVIGDRHQDLSWATGRHLGHLAEDGKTFLVGGLLPLDEFFSRYEKSSGLAVDPKRLKYFDIFNSYIAVVHMLGTAPRVAADRATHQDVVVGWLSMIGHPIAEQLRRSIEEVL
ncbi:MAG: phosphotransferase family protein, partial [Novosphingobium sp.]